MSNFIHNKNLSEKDKKHNQEEYKKMVAELEAQQSAWLENLELARTNAIGWRTAIDCKMDDLIQGFEENVLSAVREAWGDQISVEFMRQEKIIICKDASGAVVKI